MRSSTVLLLSMASLLVVAGIVFATGSLRSNTPRQAIDLCIREGTALGKLIGTGDDVLYAADETNSRLVRFSMGRELFLSDVRVPWPAEEIAITADGSWIFGFSSQVQHRMFVLNTGTSTTRLLDIEAGAQRGFAVSHGSDRVYVADGKRVLAIDGSTGATLDSLSVHDSSDASVDALALSRSGQTLYVSASARGHAKLSIMDTKSKHVAKEVTFSEASLATAIVPTHDELQAFVLFLKEADQLHVVDTVSGQVARTLTVSGQAQEMTLSADGKRIYVAVYGAHPPRIDVVDVATLEVRTFSAWQPGEVPVSIVDGKHVYVLAANEQDHTWQS